MGSTDPLTDTPGVPKSDLRLKHVAKYCSRFADFEGFASCLRDGLAKDMQVIAPAALVTARAKSVVSFAEKLLRKPYRYQDPLVDMTDLCGVRIIVHTTAEAQAVASRVMSIFSIDHENSNPVPGRRRRPNEFGYDSIHLVVTNFKDGVPSGWPTKLRRRGFHKTELQLRTIAQHCWADTGHDRLYKVDFKTPDKWKREFHRAAALLEEVDAAFLRVFHGLSAFHSAAGGCVGRSRMKSEADYLGTVLRKIGDKLDNNHRHSLVPLILRLASLRVSLGQYRELIDDLNFKAAQESSEALVYRWLAKKWANDPDLGDGKDDRKSAVAIAKRSKTTLAELLDRLPGTGIAPSQPSGTNNGLYERVSRKEPLDVRAIIAYYTALAKGQHNDPVLQDPIIRDRLRSAIKLCREHAHARVDYPWVYYHIGQLYALLAATSTGAKPISTNGTDSAVDGENGLSDDEPQVVESPQEHYDRKSLHAFAKAAQQTFGLAIFETYLKTMAKLRSSDRFALHADWVCKLLALGRWKLDTKNARKGLQKWFGADRTPLNVSGDTGQSKCLIVSLDDTQAVQYFERLFGKAFWSPLAAYAGSYVFMGSGARSLFPPNTSYKDRKIVDYATQGDQVAGKDIDHRIVPGEGPSPFHALYAWADLLMSGVAPHQVKVLGIRGGPIASTLYRVSLLMGAEVGVVQNSGDAADYLLKDPDWKDSENLTRLPSDADTSVSKFVLGNFHTLRCLAETCSNTKALRSMAAKHQEDHDCAVEIEDEDLAKLDQTTNDMMLDKASHFDVVLQHSYRLARYVENKWVFTLAQLKDKVPDLDESMFEFERLIPPQIWMDSSYYKLEGNRVPEPIGYPFAYNTMVLVYDPMSVGDHAPATWDRLVDLALDSRLNGVGKVGIALQGMDKGDWLYYEWCNFAHAEPGGGIIRKRFSWEDWDKSNLLVDNDATVAATVRYLRLYAGIYGDMAGYDRFAGTGPAGQAEELLSGGAAMGIMWTDQLYPFCLNARAKGREFGFAPLPGEMAMNGAGTFFVNSNCRKVPRVARYLIHMMQAETQGELMKRGLCSAMLKLYEELITKDVFPDEDIVRQLPKDGKWGEVRTCLQKIGKQVPIPYLRAVEKSLGNSIKKCEQPMLEASRLAPRIRQFIQEELHALLKEVSRKKADTNYDSMARKALGNAKKRIAELVEKPNGRSGVN